MRRFRSKPATCLGDRYDPAQHQDGVRYDDTGRGYVVTTHGNKVYLVPGDYFVQEPDGNGFYPVKAEIFEKRWEPDEVTP